jgi:hypothetical protein
MDDANIPTRLRVIEAIETIPDIAAREIAQLLPDMNKITVSTMLHSLVRAGLVKASGYKELHGDNGYLYRVPTYARTDKPVPDKPRGRGPAKKTVTVNHTARSEDKSNEVRELTRRVAELESWKSDAIARYPDLAADPIVLKARRLVAQEIRDSGDSMLADRVLAGAKDDGLMMRVTIKALEEVA